MKRFLAFILAFLMILCVFSACGSSKDDESENNDAEQEEEQKEEETPEDSAENKENNENSNPSDGGDGEDGDQSEDGSGDEGGNELEMRPEDYYTIDGNKITFGSYPQTLVTDAGLIAQLNTGAGNLPNAENAENWNSYGYYISGRNDTDFMWYIDVSVENDKYRGVYFVSYRPYVTSYGTDSNYAKDGFETGKIYWFKYEPLTWTILRKDDTEGTALILCDMIIDSQAYQNNYQSGGSNHIDGEAEGPYVNNYECSTIRAWLNAEFYNTAFSTSEQSLVRDTMVDNSGATTNSPTNPYASENTDDKVFLLSLQDTINTEYGFSSSKATNDTVRVKKFTDYARVQGIYEFSDQTYAGKSCWWLRSPSDTDPTKSCVVMYTGDSNNGCYVNSTNYGVVPALRIKLK